MKNTLYGVALASFLLAGCVVHPVVGPGNSSGNMCPPGQAKKGNCYPDGSFCPPGPKKQGRCPATGSAPAVEVQISPGAIRVQ